MRELFPDPTGPTMTVRDPLAISRLIFFRANPFLSHSNEASIISMAFSGFCWYQFHHHFAKSKKLDRFTNNQIS